MAVPTSEDETDAVWILFVVERWVMVTPGPRTQSVRGPGWVWGNTKSMEALMVQTQGTGDKESQSICLSSQEGFMKFTLILLKTTQGLGWITVDNQWSSIGFWSDSALCTGRSSLAGSETLELQEVVNVGLPVFLLQLFYTRWCQVHTCGPFP